MKMYTRKSGREEERIGEAAQMVQVGEGEEKKKEEVLEEEEEGEEEEEEEEGKEEEEKRGSNKYTCFGKVWPLFDGPA